MWQGGVDLDRPMVRVLAPKKLENLEFYQYAYNCSYRPPLHDSYKNYKVYVRLDQATTCRLYCAKCGCFTSINDKSIIIHLGGAFSSKFSMTLAAKIDSKMLCSKIIWHEPPLPSSKNRNGNGNRTTQLGVM